MQYPALTIGKRRCDEANSPYETRRNPSSLKSYFPHDEKNLLGSTGQIDTLAKGEVHAGLLCTTAIVTAPPCFVSRAATPDCCYLAPGAGFSPAVLERDCACR